MGIGFVILLWSIVGVLLLAVYLILSVLRRGFAIAGHMRRVMVAAVAAIAIPFGLLVVINFVLGFFPSHVFKTSFGFWPSHDVVELKGKELLIGDSGEAYLYFRADKETVHRIVSSRFLELSEPDSLMHFPSPEPLPAYWRPPAGQSVHVFKSDHFDDRFGFSQAFLIYEESSGTVYFYWTGVD